MSLHAHCPRRLASVAARRTLWRRRRGVRHYASDTANDPEWFQQVRSELLSRKPCLHSEYLDIEHREQLRATLAGFVPRPPKRSGSKNHLPLLELLTRFNARVLSSSLLPDGTDSLHSPGEPWVRRMWAGGAVTLNPNLDLSSETPFKRHSTVACVERIKDAQLRGTGDDAKIFVTIERRFASVSKHASKSELDKYAETRIYQPGDKDDDWRDTSLREERNLVFLKARKATELTEPRYLKAPPESDFSFTLRPTRSLLFRYSALTFNAHLLHLDSTYAQNAEGHRNLLVHGPLTLTLMLQTLRQRLRGTRKYTNNPETVDSIEYRNLAPLYCGEAMRICSKHKKGTDGGNVWDIWIEGPTGEMAVRAVARTVKRGNRVSAVEATPTTEEATPTREETTPATDLTGVQTVAVQAQATLHALAQPDAGKEQLSQVSRHERRKLWRINSRRERDERVARPLSYLYSSSSPLVVRVAQPAAQASAKERPEPLSQHQGPSSRRSRKPLIGNNLGYLYRSRNSPLNSRATTASSPHADPSTASTPSPSDKQTHAPPAQQPLIRSIETDSADPALALKSMQKPTALGDKLAESRESEAVPEQVPIRKVEQLRIRKTDIGLQDAARRRRKNTGAE